MDIVGLLGWGTGKEGSGKGGKVGFGSRRAATLEKSGFPFQFLRAVVMSQNYGIVLWGKDLSENHGIVGIKDLS